jgi:hypothetical protein
LTADFNPAKQVDFSSRSGCVYYYYYLFTLQSSDYSFAHRFTCFFRFEFL